MSRIPSLNYSNCSLPVKAAKLHIPVGQDGVMWFQAVGMPLISLLGLTGNVFSFIILKDGAMKSVSHFYLVCLSVFDSLSIITFQYSFYTNLVLQPILVKLNDSVITFVERYLTNYAVCPFRTYTSFSMRLISTWTIVLFTIDRLIVVAFPFQSRRISTVRNTAIILGSTVVFSFLINIPWLFSYDKNPVPCTKRVLCKGNNILSRMVFVDIVFLSVVPSLIICVCNITIIYILKKRQNHSTLFSKKEALKQEQRITIRLLLVSTIFVLLTFPALVVIVIRTHGKTIGRTGNTGPIADAFHIGNFLFLLNLSINFILYCLTGETFRKAAWSLLVCKISKMKYYRKIILQSNTSETNVTYVAGRNNSISSDKNRVIVELPNNLEFKSELKNKLTLNSKRLSAETSNDKLFHVQ